MIFSRDPGGCNAVAPLVNALREKYLVELYGKDIALRRYEVYNLKGIDILDTIGEITPKSIERFLVNQKPDFIITGTSADDMTEKYIWKSAEKLGIPSFAILDQWMNYGVRFSEFGVANLKEYDEQLRHVYLPHKILVMDEYAKKKMVDIGISNDKILVTGHPYFEYLKSISKQYDKGLIQEVRSKRLKSRNKEFIITFVSEPITTTYRESGKDELYWGYTEKTIFMEFIKALNKFAGKTNSNIKLIIRLHPKEAEDSYNELINLADGKHISVLIDNEMPGLELIHASDLICGMSSMFLLESSILDKPIISIQIGLLGFRENPFILHNKGILKSILSSNDLEKELTNILIDKKTITNKLDLIDNPIKNVIMFMEEILWQN